MPVAPESRFAPGEARLYDSGEIPERDLDRTISHLFSTIAVNAGHLAVHAEAAQAATEPPLTAHHLKHALGHARVVSEHLEKFRGAISRRVPAVGVQLTNLDQATPAGRAAGPDVPAGALDMSIAHDLASSQAAAAHVNRHLTEARAAHAAGNKVSTAFNISHAVHHVGEITSHLAELSRDLPRRLPAVAAETAALDVAWDPPDPARSWPHVPAGYDFRSRPGPEPA
jgi:hypothetical protein